MTDAIPERFRSAVSLHLVANFQPSARPGTPVLLAVQGPPGEGKTYQLDRVLEDAGIVRVLLSGGELESPNAGEPAARVRAAYLEAGAHLAAGSPAAVVINDADAAIGSWGDLTQYTVNTQNLVTELMHLADYPTRVEGRTVRRVPIVLTGNDFTRLYAPLRRSGRMRTFTWAMEPSERAAAVLSLFPALDDADADRLVTKFADQPVAFWAAVRSRMDDGLYRAALQRHGLARLVRELLSGLMVQTDDRDHRVEDIAALAETLADERARDFLPAPSEE